MVMALAWTWALTWTLAWPASARAQGEPGGGLESKLDAFVGELANDNPMTLAVEGERMTKEEADRIELALTVQPYDLKARSRLLGYYLKRASQSASGRRARQQHILWLIGQDPGSEIAGSRYAALSPTADRDVLDRAVQAWLRQARARPRNDAVLRNAADGLARLAPEKAEEAILRGATLQPFAAEWPARLGALDAIRATRATGDARGEWAKKAMASYEQALKLAEAPDERASLLDNASEAALVVGEVAKAKQWALALLDRASDPGVKGAWAQHRGHVLLGLIAMQEGDMATARDHLAASARLRVSPFSQGREPATALAAALARRGQAEATLSYLDSCQALWPAGAGRLDAWRAALRAGSLPADWTRGAED
jgi:tetratricopeptide (TPR) repeat protein